MNENLSDWVMWASLGGAFLTLLVLALLPADVISKKKD